MEEPQHDAAAIDRLLNTISLDVDEATLADLAAISLTHLLWRNTEVEDAHHAGRWDDGEMMVANIRTYRLVRGLFRKNDISWLHLDRALFDPSREPLDGKPQRQLLRGWMTAWRRTGRNRLWGQCENAENIGHDRWLQVMALMVVGFPGYGQHWYGCPWWPDLVDEFMESIAGRNDLPVPGTELAEALRDQPDVLPASALRWCIDHGLRAAHHRPMERWCETHVRGAS